MMKNISKIGVLGAGTWGIALARMLCNAGNSVTVWSAIEKEIADLSATGNHPSFPDIDLPKRVTMKCHECRFQTPPCMAGGLLRRTVF